MLNFFTSSLGQRRQKWWKNIHFDPILIFFILTLSCFGLLVLYSASGQSWDIVKKQIIYFLIGFVVMLTLAQPDAFFYKRISKIFYFVVLFSLVITLIIAPSVNGSRRWINLYFFNFQASEFMKLALPLFVASYISQHTYPPKFIYFFIAMLAVMFPAVLVYLQPDLGTALLIVISGLVVIFLAGLSWKVIVGALGSIMLVSPIIWIFVLHGYHKRRIQTLLNPESDPLGFGWNIIQAKTAVGSGGMLGKGWLNGTQGQFDFLPESHTDFIIGIIGEELGFIGICIFFALYLIIILRCLSIAIEARNSFDRIVAGALTSIFFLYVFINAGMVSGILPVVGVPMPFVSYGGSSIVSLMAAMGIIMSISAHNGLSGADE